MCAKLTKFDIFLPFSHILVYFSKFMEVFLKKLQIRKKAAKISRKSWCGAYAAASSAELKSAQLGRNVPRCSRCGVRREGLCRLMRLSYGKRVKIHTVGAAVVYAFELLRVGCTPGRVHVWATVRSGYLSCCLGDGLGDGVRRTAWCS